jgi:probable F420-dependent oxidoreductase
MNYWLNAGFIDASQLVPIAQAAERLGFYGIALPDHLFFPETITSKYPYSRDGSVMWPAEAPWPDCWVAIATMAQATQRLRFSTGVYVAPLRDPFSLAKAIGTASVLSGGRVVCGFGSGWLAEEFDVLGVDFASRGKRFDEMLNVMKLLWTGEAVSFHGAHFDFPPIRMCPAAPSIPICIGGNTTPALRRAAQHDGWIASHNNNEQTAGLVAKLKALRAEVGREGEPFAYGATISRANFDGVDGLTDLGIDSVTFPVAALTRSTELAARIEAMEQFAATNI